MTQEKQEQKPHFWIVIDICISSRGYNLYLELNNKH